MKHAWNLPESILSYGIEHFEKYIESNVQETILNDNPVPEKMKEMLLEATKFRELEQDRSLAKIQQNVFRSSKINIYRKGRVTFAY